MLLVGDDYSKISLRKLNDLSASILYYEHDRPMTWVLFMHETALKKSQYNFTIGGIDQGKVYTEIIHGTLYRHKLQRWG